MPLPYKVRYFNGRGRAEIMRLIFAEAAVEYEDQRIDYEKWTAQDKAATPFGQLPVLEVDGVQLCQSNACARYLARKFHLAGKTDLEQAQADMVIDCLEDSYNPMIPFLFEEDEVKKVELKEKYINEKLSVYLTYLEALLKQNHGGDGYFVGTELTWADLGLLIYDSWLLMAGISDPFAMYPKLKALKEKVEKLPKIAAWIAKRPVTEY